MKHGTSDTWNTKQNETRQKQRRKKIEREICEQNEVSYARQTTSITLMLCDVNRNNIHSAKFCAIYRYFLSSALTKNGTKRLCIVLNTCSLFRAAWKMSSTKEKTDRLINGIFPKLGIVEQLKQFLWFFFAAFLEMNLHVCDKNWSKRKKMYLRGENRMEIVHSYSQFALIFYHHKNIIYHLTHDSLL